MYNTFIIRLILSGILLVSLTVSNAQRRILVNGHRHAAPPSDIPAGVVAKFNFSLTAVTVSDWVNVNGDPNDSVISRSDSRSGQAVTVSSVNTSRWVPLSGQTEAASQAGGTNTGDAVFPQNVNRTYWYTWITPNTNVNLSVSGLEPGVAYTIQIRACRDVAGVALPNRYQDILCVDANVTQRIEDIDVKANISTTSRTVGSGAGTGIATFTTRIADGSGVLNFVITPPSPTSGDYPYAYLNGIIITKE